MRYIRCHVTSELSHSGGLHMCRVITKQLMYGSACITLDFSASTSGLVDKKLEHSAFSLVFYFYQFDWKLVQTNPMLHAEPYISYYLSLTRVPKNMYPVCTEHAAITAHSVQFLHGVLHGTRLSIPSVSRLVLQRLSLKFHPLHTFINNSM